MSAAWPWCSPACRTSATEMKLLVIGSGGREHAMAWKLAQGPRVQKVYVAPGNAGTALEPGLENVALTAIPELVSFARENSIQLTVVGPEAPLAAGVVDAFSAAGLRIFGPTRAAAQLESSKDFAKSFMVRHGIPTPRHASFERAADAKAHIVEHGAPIVIKADGLAAGKGVVVARTREEAHAAIDMMLTDQRLGAAGSRVVIEEFLEGEEASFIVISDGAHVLTLATSQDHKRLMREIILPTVHGMAKDGVPYTGFLYAGLIIDQAGNPKALEFNCRLGDPEAQPILLRLKSDLFELLEHALAGTLDRAEADWDRRSALGVVLAAHGYPEEPRKGDRIDGLPRPADDCRVFHAGTRLEGRSVLTNGGRVLCVTALGDSVKMARGRAYDAVERIRFDGMQFRKDIGHRALKKTP